MTTTETPEQIWAESRKRLIPGTVIGSVIEWYDIAVYGQAAALGVGTLFFPSFSPTTASGRRVRHLRGGLLRATGGSGPVRSPRGDRDGMRLPRRAALLLDGRGGDAAIPAPAAS